MDDENGILTELFEMSTALGSSHNDDGLMAEGNTSAPIDAESFWVKASSVRLSRVVGGREATECPLGRTTRTARWWPRDLCKRLHNRLLAGRSWPVPRFV